MDSKGEDGDEGKVINSKCEFCDAKFRKLACHYYTFKFVCSECTMESSDDYNLCDPCISELEDDRERYPYNQICKNCDD